MSFFKQFSAVPRGLKYKLSIAFALMSILPLLIFMYVIYQFLPELFVGEMVSLEEVSLLVLVALAISLLGFYFARGIISPILDLAVKARIIASGDQISEIEVTSEDEVGYLGKALNEMNKRLNENVMELQSYEEKVREINMEINKKMFSLSALFQIGKAISSAQDINSVLKLIIEKCVEAMDAAKGWIFLVDGETGDLIAKVGTNVLQEDFANKKIKKGEDIFAQVASDCREIVIDKNSKSDGFIDKFKEEYKVDNGIIVPIISKGRCIGVLGVGNELPDFNYRIKDDTDLINIFSRQVSVAIENYELINKTRELSMRDEVTGLYNDKYFEEKLTEEVKRAIKFRRPCALGIVDIDDVDVLNKLFGSDRLDSILRIVGKMVLENIEETDKASHLGKGRFAVIFPEKNKKEGFDLVEKLRKAIESSNIFGEKAAEKVKLTISAGIVANPMDGVNAKSLKDKALYSVDEAKKAGKNKVVMFNA